MAHRLRFRLLAWTALCILAACGGSPAPPRATASPTPPAIATDWNDPGLSIDAGSGWTVTRCGGDQIALCVDKDGTPAGRIMMEDLPTLGEELTSSKDQVRATLAVRTQTVYRELIRLRAERCGEGYSVSTDIPRPAAIAGQQGLSYGATGAQGGETVERTLGYRVFREGIETLVETTAIDPGGCLTPGSPMFTTAQLAEFAPLLDRIVAGSTFPPPTDFPDLPVVPGGSRDPRLEHQPENGIALSH